MDIIYPSSIDDYRLEDSVEIYTVDDLVHFMNSLSAELRDIEIPINILKAIPKFKKGSLTNVVTPKTTPCCEYALWFYCQLGLVCLSTKKFSNSIVNAVIEQLNREIAENETEYVFKYLSALFDKYDAQKLNLDTEIALSSENVIKLFKGFSPIPKHVISWIDHSFNSLTNFTICVEILGYPRVSKQLTKLRPELQASMFTLFPEARNDVSCLEVLIQSDYPNKQKINQIRYFFLKSQQKTLKILKDVNMDLFADEDGHYLIFEIFDSLLTTNNLILINYGIALLKNFLSYSAGIYPIPHQICSMIVENQKYMESCEEFLKIMLENDFDRLSEAYSLFKSAENYKENYHSNFIKFVNENFATKFLEVENKIEITDDIVNSFNLILKNKKKLEIYHFGFLRIHKFIALNSENMSFLEDEKIYLIPKFLFLYENRIIECEMRKIARKISKSAEVEMLSIDRMSETSFDIFTQVYSEFSSEKLLKLAQKMASVPSTLPTMILINAMSTDFIENINDLIFEILSEIDLTKIYFLPKIFARLNLTPQKIVNLADKISSDIASVLTLVNMIFSLSKDTKQVLNQGVRVLEFFLETRGDFTSILATLIFFDKIVDTYPGWQTVDQRTTIRDELARREPFKTLFEEKSEISLWFEEKGDFPKKHLPIVPFLYDMYPTRLMDEYDELVTQCDDLEIFIGYLVQISKSNILLTPLREDIIRSKCDLFDNYLWRFEDILPKFRFEV